MTRRDTMTPGARGEAQFSPCGAYRYTLTRDLGGPGRMVFVMLNPSTATAEANDPTIRRCIGFAQREGFGGLLILNLMALRSTDPRGLLEAADPVGPDNHQALRAEVAQAVAAGEPVICAWGAHRATRLPAATRSIEIVAGAAGGRLHCLGLTRFGAPRHPLYLPKNAPLSHWRQP